MLNLVIVEWFDGFEKKRTIIDWKTCTKNVNFRPRNFISIKQQILGKPILEKVRATPKVTDWNLSGYLYC